jgi:hypothetical protein
MSEIAMRRNAADVWPDDAPPGTFDIEACTVTGRGVTGRIAFVCPHGNRCGVYVGPESEARPTPDAPHVWGWNGHLERPTLTPSIDCKGCWHGFITDGVMR